MSSASSPVRAVLEDYVAGRVTAERVVAAVAAAYYNKEQGAGSRERLRPILAVIERAHPGVIELASTPDKPGFAVRLAERPFPKEYEGSLREAVEGVLASAGQPAAPGSVLRAPGLWSRFYAAVRRLLSASV
jgi:hypothetical protein